MSGKMRASLISLSIIILTSGGLLIWDLTGHRTTGEAPWIPYLHAFMFVMAVGALIANIRDKKSLDYTSCE